MRLAGAFRQLGLGIKQVHLAGAAVLDHLNHGPRPARKGTLARFQIAVELAFLFGV